MEPFALDTTRIGLLVVDMQNDFVREGAPQEVPDARATIPVIASLLEAFRAAGRPVLYTRFTAGPQRTLLWRWSPECGPELRSCWPGELREYADAAGPLEGHAVIDELAPRAGEPVIDKYGYGGFHNTALEGALRAHRVDQVVVTGTVTQICVEETAREAFRRGFEVVVVADAVTSFDPELHRASLRNLAAKFALVVGSADLAEALGASGAARSGSTA